LVLDDRHDPGGETRHLQNLYYHRLHRLASVSQAWLALVKGCATLWTLLDSRESGMVSAALARSKDLPIKVVILERHSSELWSSVATCVGRWKSAELWLSSNEEHRGTLESLPATAAMLETLDLHACSLAITPLILNLQKGDSLRLLDLRLDSVTIQNWDASFMGALRTLELTHHRRRPILRRSEADIEELALRDVRFRAEVSATRYDVVHLAKLTSLILNISGQVARSIILAIEPPNLKALHFNPGCLDLLGSNFDIWKLRAAPALRQVLLSDSVVAVQLDGTDSMHPSIVVATRSREFHLGFPRSRATQWTLSLLLPFKSVQVDLTIRNINVEKIDSNQDILTLQGLSSTRSLRTFRILFHDRLVRRLSERQALDGKLQWVFPNLESVHFDAYHPRNTESLVHLAYARGQNRAVQGGTGEPVPIKKLVLTGWKDGEAPVTEDIFRTLCRALGPGVVEVHTMDSKNYLHRTYEEGDWINDDEDVEEDLVYEDEGDDDDEGDDLR
ncbi:hypothetical protein FRB98_005072, partial [Tulasnella sp. 332]